MRQLLQSEGVCLRHGRHVLAIKAELKRELDGIILDRSQTGATVYIEPRELVLLANEVDDLRFEERREVERILWQLTIALREQREPILATLDALARLDCTYAKARFSLDFDMSPPEINEVGHLDVRRARHPILVRVIERGSEQANLSPGERSPASGGRVRVPLDLSPGERSPASGGRVRVPLDLSPGERSPASGGRVRVPSVACVVEQAPSPQPSPQGRGGGEAPSPQPSPQGRGGGEAPSPQPSPQGRGGMVCSWTEAGEGGSLRRRGVVPIDYRLGEDFDLLVVTGPNTGGKTVALKTIGLLGLMAQSGMHVPAEPGAKFPVYENILADIGDEQSIEQSLSTFSSHVRNLVRILGQARRRTLVLLDELGAGTDPTEGAALGTAVLDFLAHCQAKVVVTTHIGDLKAYAYRHPRCLNAACEFDQESLQPTYRLLMGQPGNSNAVAIAERLGLPCELIRRAREALGRTKGRDSELISELEQARRGVEDDREKARALRAELETLREKAEAEWR
ncbi:MAG: hypothetical protein FJ291_32585, partial [Planctomycetes bacterium]|nr:hypothetical protein [Planctomycetota bacterium]